VGHRARGLLAGWDGLAVFSTRSCSQPCISLGRGRALGNLRSGVPVVFRPGAVEWPRSNSQGTTVRADRAGGQSWRRLQGVLLLSRCHADALVPESALQVSAGRVPLSTFV